MDEHGGDGREMNIGDMVEITNPKHETCAGIGVIIGIREPGENPLIPASEGRIYTVAVLLSRWTPYVFHKWDFKLRGGVHVDYSIMDDILDDIEDQGCPMRVGGKVY